MKKWRVIYLKNKKECKSAWFYSHDRAREAMRIICGKYGERNAILYRD